MKSVNFSGLENNPSVALVIDSFKKDELSLSQSAKAAGVTTAAFIAHISRLGIPVIGQSAEEAENDMDTLDEWLASSFQMQPHTTGSRAPSKRSILWCSSKNEM